MSVKDEYGMKCPKCGRDDELVVTFTGQCKLLSDGSDDIGDHAWGDESRCICNHCDHAATVADFKAKE